MGLNYFKIQKKFFLRTKKEYNKTLFIIGGRETILSTIHLVDEILINIIPGEYTCDTFFPEQLLNKFDKVEQYKNPNSGIEYLKFVRKKDYANTKS